MGMPGNELTALIAGMEYDVGERIGRGGSSDVYLARHKDGKEAALKIYNPFGERDVGAVSDKMSTEAQMICSWDSPWIVKGYGLRVPEHLESNAILAMEFMSKGAIEKVVGELTSHQKVMVIISATLGLDFMHSRGVIHGDIKPSNLLLDANFHAKLSDLGCARSADGSTVTRIPVTLAYAPQELQEGKSPTERSDIYSLGLLALFVITGKHPFDPEMPTRRLMRAIDAGVDVNLPGVRSGLVGLVKSMVVVQPAGRPGSVKAVLESICETEFAFWSDVDPVAVRSELARLGVEEIPFEGEVARVMRENIELKLMIEQERTASEAQQNEIMTLRHNSVP
jgi:serine/threonine protein kinase